MYSIVCTDNTVLYDQSNTDVYMVDQPSCDVEIGQAGSLSFDLFPDHPYYDRVGVMETYLSAYDESDEIFYGRVININDNRLTGVRSVECAGALSFLEDAELPPFNTENNEMTLTGTEYLTLCINAFNSEIGTDPKRNLSLGTVSHSKASVSQKFSNNSYLRIDNALQTNLINNINYGGYLIIRNTNNGHVIDWVESFTTLCESPIRTKVNVHEHENEITANDFYTVIRPTGKDGLTLTEDTVNISDELVSKYGKIVRNVSFNDVETEADLRTETARFIAWINMGLGKTATIKVIDLGFLYGTTPKIVLGGAYNNIDGFVGETLVIASMHWNFVDPSDNSVTIKNSRDLTANKGSGGGGMGNGAAASTGSASKAFANIYNHITETQDSLMIHAKTIEIHGQQILETATEFERYSRASDTRFENTESAIGVMQGTGVMQNTDHITQVAGTFSVRYVPVPSSKVTGKNPHNQGWYTPNFFNLSEQDVENKIDCYGSLTAATQGILVPKNRMTVGLPVCTMSVTSDTSPQSGVTYYTKNLGVSDGTLFEISEEGQRVTVGEQLGEIVDDVQTIQGSALWVERNHITGVCGQYEVETDPTTHEQTLVILSGGGLKIRKEESGYTSEFGVYDQSTLTAGVIATIVNGESSTYIYADNIKMSSATGANSVAVEVSGKITANEVTANLIKSRIADIPLVEYNTLDGATVYASSSVQAANFYFSSNDTLSSLKKAICKATVSGNTLTLTDFNGDDVTFSKATSLSGSWSGGTLTVTATPQNETFTVSDITDAGHWGNTANNESASTYYMRLAVKHNGANTLHDTGAVLEVDASSMYQSGRGSVIISSIEVYGSPAADATSITVKATASNGATDTGSVNIQTQRNNAYNAGAASVTLTQGSWADGAKTVTASNGATQTVSIPAVSSTTWTNTTGRTWRADLSIGGTTRYSSTKDFQSYYDAGYNAGWNDCRTASRGDYYQYGFYTGTWAGTLYATQSDYAQEVYNCVKGATGHAGPIYTWTDPGTK